MIITQHRNQTVSKKWHGITFCSHPIHGEYGISWSRAGIAALGEASTVTRQEYYDCELTRYLHKVTGPDFSV